LRIDQEDTFYHVLNRGNERRAIFREEQDRAGFLTRLGQIAPHFGVGYAAVSHACRRTERRLERDRKWQRRLRGCLE
jgi:hypothetical protein